MSCGTPAGFSAHYRNGTTPCAACVEARNERRRGIYVSQARTKETARHGTRSRYMAGCRCDDCRKASADYNRQWRYKIQRTQPTPDRHGNISTYANWGCRCEACRAAMAAYHQRRKAAR